jgi:hypothetical protein
MSATIVTAEASSRREATPITFQADSSRGSPRQAPTVRPGKLRPVRDTGRGLSPRARPANPLRAPTLAATEGPKSRACIVPAAPAQLRLTDRAIGLIIVAGLMIVIAAVTVVGLTAARVTGDGTYQPQTTSQSLHP